MSEIARHPGPEKIPVPTGQLNAFLAVEAIRTALLATTAAAAAAVEAAHTALDRERAGIVVVSAIRRRTTAIPSKIIKIKVIKITI